MPDLQPLTVLLGQSQRERDAALAEHQRVQAACAATSAQADQLRTYRREYEQRWNAQFSRTGQIEVVRCYHTFMERLSLAVDQQTRLAEQSAQQLKRTHALLCEAELRCASVRKLIERRTIELRLEAERIDQKQNDERATRAAWTNRLGADGQTRLM